MRMLSAASAAVAVLVLAGCTSVTSVTDVAAAPVVTTKAPVVTTKASVAPAKVSSNCVAVSSALGQSIISGAEPGAGTKFLKAAAVKSPDFDQVYFIALKFSVTGVDNQVGVFASTALTDGGGMVLAVDGTAKQFTVWPDADKTDVAISGADPSVAVVKACLK